MTRQKRVCMSQKSKYQTLAGDPITVGDITITPQAQSISLGWPFGGWVWNRPTAILVERPEGTESIPILDITRLIQLALLGIGLLFFILTRRKQNEQRE